MTQGRRKEEALSAWAGTEHALLLSIHSECMYVRVKDTCHKIDDELRRKYAAAAVVGWPISHQVVLLQVQLQDGVFHCCEYKTDVLRVCNNTKWFLSVLHLQHGCHQEILCTQTYCCFTKVHPFAFTVTVKDCPETEQIFRT